MEEDKQVEDLMTCETHCGGYAKASAPLCESKQIKQASRRFADVIAGYKPAIIRISIR